MRINEIIEEKKPRSDENRHNNNVITIRGGHRTANGIGGYHTWAII